jgi:hypothetical protein
MAELFLEDSPIRDQKLAADYQACRTVSGRKYGLTLDPGS